MKFLRANLLRGIAGWVCFLVAFGSVFSAGARAEIVVDDNFEFRWKSGLPFVSGSSIGDYTGWYIVRGKATVSSLTSRSGRTVLAIPEAYSGIERIWVRFRMRPAPGKVLEPYMVLSVFGAKLAFPVGVDDGASDWVREMLAFDATSGEVVPTSLAVGEGGWLQLMFEVTPEEWRLHDPGGPISDWLGLDLSSSKSINWFGDATGDIFIDDVQVAIVEPGQTDARPPWEQAWGIESRLVVISATYGSGSQHADVTGRVAELLGEGDDFFARPQWLQKDPTPGWNKELKIVYEYHGARHTFRSGEGGRVNPEILKAQAGD